MFIKNSPRALHQQDLKLPLQRVGSRSLPLTGFAQEMIFMANRLVKVVGLVALVVSPAHSQNLSVLDQAVDHNLPPVHNRG